MSSAVFTGVIERASDGFGVFFPDVPGCTSAGDTLAQALENGELALAAHIELMAEDGDDLPEPSVEPEIGPEVDVAALFLARVELPGRSVRVNITMPEGLVERIDRVAKNRSAFLAEAARAALNREAARG